MDSNFKNLSDRDLTILLNTELSEDSFIEIYNRYWRSMFNAAYKRLADEVQCQDIVQNVFLDIWQKRKQIAIEDLSAFLHTAVRYQVIKYSTRLREKVPLVSTIDQFMISSFKADDTIYEAEIGQLLKLWIAALSEKQKQAFLLFYMEGLDVPEIASHLGTSEKTIQNYIANATSDIRKKLSREMIIRLGALYFYYWSLIY